LVPALVRMLRVPVTAPAAVGWKLIDRVQELPAAREVPQFPGISVKPLPVTVTLPGVTGKVPVLVRVNVSGEGSVFDSPTVALLKLKLAGVSVAVGVGAATPFPVRVLVLVPALVMMLMVPVAVPTAVGWKVTAMVQELPAAREVPQFPDMRVKPLPVTETLPGVTATVPVFVSVNVSGEGSVLDSPTVAAPKLKLAGVKDAVGVGAATPVPVRDAVVAMDASVESLMENVEARVPALAGLKVKVSVQEAPLANAPLQLSVSVKSVASVSVPLDNVMELAVPLVRVEVCVALEAPMVVFGKFCVVGVRFKDPLAAEPARTKTVAE